MELLEMKHLVQMMEMEHLVKTMNMEHMVQMMEMESLVKMINMEHLVHIVNVQLIAYIHAQKVNIEGKALLLTGRKILAHSADLSLVFKTIIANLYFLNCFNIP